MNIFKEEARSKFRISSLGLTQLKLRLYETILINQLYVEDCTFSSNI